MTTSPLSEPPAPPAPARRPVGAQITPDDLVQVADLLVRTVPGCDHACVIVTPQRGVEVAGASDEVAGAAADLMLTLGSPVPAPLQKATSIDALDLRDGAPWPEVARALTEDVKVGGMVGRRLVAGERRLGFLALYSDEPGALVEADPAVIESLTTLVAGWVVAHETANEVRHLRVALDNARTMGRAVGMLMVQRGMLPSEAVDYLRTMSNKMNVRVRELAVAMLRTHEERLAARHIAGSARPVPGPTAPAGRSTQPDAIETRPSDKASD